MKKIDIISALNSIGDIVIPDLALEELTKFLKDYEEYYMVKSKDRIVIQTKIKEGKYGTYHEAICECDRETNNFSLITMSKEYSPQNEVRYDFMEEVGFNIFSNISSYVYDENGLMIYYSWFSDENKYYGNDEIENLDYSSTSLKKYFDETSPKYEKGYMVESPKNAYRPFKTRCQRYGKSHVFKINVINPIFGERTEIGITFDGKENGEQTLLSEKNGQICCGRREMKLTDEMEIVNSIEQIYQENCTEAGFDMNNFNREFEDAMFEPRKIR